LSASVCHAITRQSASNLAQAFVVLPRDRRADMAVLYAFCRAVDDVADEETAPVETRRQQLAAWREDLRAACGDGAPRFPINRELQPVIHRRHLPFEHFDEIIRGCEMDLDARDYATLDELDLYCYRVASAVGLLSIEVFGYQNPRTREYAVALGKAFQLTNILRDVAEDAGRGRVYLPLDELGRFQVQRAEIIAGKYSDRYRALASAVAGRARAFYAGARATLPPEDRRSMIAAELMGAVYWQLLRRLEACGFDVFGRDRVRLGKAAKLGLIARTWWRLRVGPFAPGYGA